MALLDLKTDLKSLKYGNDTPGGGNSGQPYQQVDINTADRMTKFDDGLVRGGIVGAANAAVVDTFRIGKWLTDFPKGPLWIVKQVGLQLSNPKLETRKFPSGPGFLGTLGTIANFVQDKLGIGPTRIYNLGINTLSQVPVNAFGQHFDRHGIFPVQDDNTKYLAVAQFNNQGNGKNNKLEGLRNRFGLGNTPPSGPTSFLRLSRSEKKVLRLGKKLFNDIQSSKIDDYFGGPNSVYGIGRTLIKRYDYTRTELQGKEDKNNPYKLIIPFTIVNDLGVSRQYFTSEENDTYNFINLENPTIKPTNLDISTYSKIVTEAVPLTVDFSTGPSAGEISTFDLPPIIVKESSLPSYQTYKKIIESRKLTQYNYTVNTRPVNEFGIYGNNTNTNGVIGDSYKEISPDSNNLPIYSNKKKVIILQKSWKEINREIRVGSGEQDQINLTPLFENTAGTMGDNVTIGGEKYNINDLVKFRIQALNGSNPTQASWMIFRAYITQFSDTVEAKWNSVTYVGRGEEFYIYSGFGRKVNIGFKVATLSAEEMKPMYQKLNYLMGNLMPDYNGLLMRGPLVKMTVGNWLDGQDGILNSLSYTVPNDSPWEIGLRTAVGGIEPLILPHVLEVSMIFTPIGSQTKGANKISEKNFETSHIAQNVNKNETQYISGNIGST